LLMPFQRTARAVDLEPQVVLATVRNAGSRDRAERPILKPQDGRAVVIQRALGMERSQVTGNLLGPEAADELDQIVGVNADVAETSRDSRSLRVLLPGESALLLRSPLPVERSLQVAGADGMDVADVAVADHLPRLAHQQVAGVVVQDGEDHAGRSNQFGQLLGLLEAYRHWLVADDVEAGFDERP